MRIVELPLPLCPSGQLALAALVHRESPLAVGFSVWLGDDLDFNGDTPPETYNFLAAHNRFAQHGVVNADYPAATFALDFEIGLQVTLDGVDKILDAPTSANGLDGELLVFVGSEIMSVLGTTLVGVGTYRLQLARGMYGTPISTHEAGEEIYIVPKDFILPLAHNRFVPGAEISLKIPVEFTRYQQDLEAVEVTEYEVTGRAFDVSPSNLRVNGEQRNVRFTPGADVRIDWSLPELRDGIQNQFGLKVRTLVEIVTLADEVIYKKLTSAQFFKIGGAKMDAIRDGATEFVVRLSTDVIANDRISSTPITLNVKQA